MRFAWKGEKVTDSTSDYAKIRLEPKIGQETKHKRVPENGKRILVVLANVNSIQRRYRLAHSTQLDSCYMTQHSVLGTVIHACESKLEDGIKIATFGDQSMSVIDLFFPYLSSQNSHTRLTRFPSDSSLYHHEYKIESQKLLPTLQIQR